MSLFWYKRKVKEKQKIEATEDHPAGEKEVEVVYWDCFNTDCVIRAFWFNKKQFMILLNDGHEQSQDTQVAIKNKAGHTTGYETKRQRDWFYSQIELDREDAERLWRGQNHPSLGEHTASA